MGNISVYYRFVPIYLTCQNNFCLILKFLSMFTTNLIKSGQKSELDLTLQVFKQFFRATIKLTI